MTTTDDRDCAAEAARWHARLLALDVTEGDRARFARWKADPANAAAYARVQELDRAMRGLEADPRLQEMLQRARELAPEPVKPRRPLLPVAMAASLLVLGLGALLANRHLESHSPVYSNSSSQQQRIALSDGSVVYLDVDSQMSVEFVPAARHVELVKGRALFEVAKDATRPFSVNAGGTSTVALGTRFQVQNETRDVIVTLAEGSVAVSGRGDEGPWKQRLSPGEQLSVGIVGGEPQRRVVDAQLVTSWSIGRHVYRGTPLVDVLADVNRYTARKIRLADASLGALPVGGSFIAGNSEVIVAALEAILPVRAVSAAGDEILLVRRTETPVR